MSQMINLDPWCPSVHVMKAELKVFQAKKNHVCFHTPAWPQGQLLYAGLWNV